MLRRIEVGTKRRSDELLIIEIFRNGNDEYGAQESQFASGTRLWCRPTARINSTSGA